MEERPNPLDSDEITVASASFSDDMVEVDFFDPRRQSDAVMEFTKIVIDKNAYLDSVEYIEEQLRDLIDDALSDRRK